MPLPTVERSDLITKAARHLQRPVGSQENFVVRGAAGMGKTKTLEALRDWFVANMAEEGPALTALLPMERFQTSEQVDTAESVHRLTRAIVEQTGGQAGVVDRLPWRHRAPGVLFRQVLENDLFRRTDGRVLLLFDNFHALQNSRNATDISDMLRTVSEAVYEAPINRLHIVVASTAPLSVLGSAFASLAPWQPLRVGPLSEACVRELVARATVSATKDEGDAIHRLSGGHPTLLSFAQEVGGESAGAWARWLEGASESERVERWFEPARQMLLKQRDYRDGVRALLGGEMRGSSVAFELERFGLVDGNGDDSAEEPTEFRPIGEVCRRWLERACA